MDYTNAEIKTVKPKNLEDAQTVANCLRNKIPVIVNFEETAPEEVKRIMDFISGSNYALDGKVEVISQSKKVYLFAPKNIDVEPNAPKKSW